MAVAPLTMDPFVLPNNTGISRLLPRIGRSSGHERPASRYTIIRPIVFDNTEGTFRWWFGTYRRFENIAATAHWKISLWTPAAISSSLCTNSPTETLFLLLPFFSVYLLLDSARISLYTSKSRGEGGENRRGVIVIRDIQTYFRKLNRISRSGTWNFFESISTIKSTRMWFFIRYK